jgi:hypothetical protein
MNVRRFALIFGIVYLLVGVMGLIPALLTPMTAPGVTVDTLSGNLLGVFPVNIVHTLVHLIFGIWGIVAYRSYSGSRSFAWVAGIVFLALALFGLIPGLNTLFGLAPLTGSDIWLHALSGVLALAFAIMARTPVEEAVDRTVDRIE